MEENTIENLSRRDFLFRSGKSLALLAAANAGVYVIGSAFKELDGRLVAGAKMCDCWVQQRPGNCGHSGPLSAIENWMIDVPNPSCSANSCSTSGHWTVWNCQP